MMQSKINANADIGHFCKTACYLSLLQTPLAYWYKHTHTYSVGVYIYNLFMDVYLYLYWSVIFVLILCKRADVKKALETTEKGRTLITIVETGARITDVNHH